MTDHLSNRKYRLIQQIIHIQNEKMIDLLEQEMKAMQLREANLWASVIRPTRTKLSLGEMIAEQGYKPITSASFFKLADEIGIDDSIEDLLMMLD